MKKYFLKEIKSNILKYICDIFVIGTSAYLSFSYCNNGDRISILWLLICLCNILITGLDLKNSWISAEDKFNQDNSL